MSRQLVKDPSKSAAAAALVSNAAPVSDNAPVAAAEKEKEESDEEEGLMDLFMSSKRDGEHIPLKVMMEHIFVRMPWESLSRCKCVCKDWLQILSGSKFSKLHIQHQTEDNRHLFKILCGPLEHRNGMMMDKTQGMFFTLDFGSQYRARSEITLNRLPGFPLETDFWLSSLLGYSNSMLCFMAYKKSDKRCYIIFWNPSTRYHHVLPEPLGRDRLQCTGFGYDSSADDYKFVTVENAGLHPRARVFSLNSNLWSSNKDASDELKIEIIDYKTSGTFATGSIYWYGYGAGSKRNIVGFDLKDENFIELPLPCDLESRSKSLNVLQGSLCAIFTRNDQNKKTEDVEMWLLKEENIWCKLIRLTNYSVEFPLEFMTPISRFKEICPLAILPGGRRLACSYKYTHFRISSAGDNDAMRRSLECNHISKHPETRYCIIDLDSTRIIERINVVNWTPREETQSERVLTRTTTVLVDHNFQSHFPGHID